MSRPRSTSIKVHVLVGTLALLVMLAALVGITLATSELPTPAGTISASAPETDVAILDNPSQTQTLERIKAQSPELEARAREQGLVLVCEATSLPPGGQTRCGPGTPAALTGKEQVVATAHGFGTRGWIAVEAGATLVALLATILGARRIARRGDEDLEEHWVEVDAKTGLRTWH